MSDYTKTTDFLIKDALSSGNPSKLVRGTELDAEFNNIVTAVVSKQNSSEKGQTSGYADLNSSGKVPDARVSASSVTQHQASLSIAGSQLTGTFADARVVASNVTQHQASLSIAGSQITSGTVATARLGSGTASATTALKGNQAYESVMTSYGVYKASQTVRASTITLTDDPDLTIASIPAGTYIIRCFIVPQCPSATTSGLQCKINFGGTYSAGSGRIHVNGIVNNANYPNVVYSAANSTQQYSDITTSSVFDFLIMEAVAVTTTTGSIALAWAQKTNSANSTIINPASWLTVTKIG